MTRVLPILTLAALLATVLVIPAAQAGPAIVEEYDPAMALGTVIRSAEAFAGRLSVGGFVDTRTLTGDTVMDLARDLGLRTPSGQAVTDVIVDPVMGSLLGVAGGDIEVTGILPDGAMMVAYKDRSGRYRPLQRRETAWAWSDGSPVCYDVTPVTAFAPDMHFTLLLDRSGSMRRVARDVLAMARRFLDALPPQALCTVATFAGDRTFVTPPTGQPCGQVILPPRLNADGGTDIYGALAEAYADHTQPRFEGWQKAIILVTDGVITTEPDEAARLKADLLRRKQDTSTIVFWLGRHSDAHLRDIADYGLHTRLDIRRTLGRSLEVLSDAYRTQQVLTPIPGRACGP